MARLTVVGIDHMATRATRMTIIARLVIRPHEPHEGIVQPGLVDVEHRDRNAQAGPRPPVGLFQIGPPRFLEPLDQPGGVGNADLGELRGDIAPAALEHAKHIARRDHVPCRHRIKRRHRAAIFLRVGDGTGGNAGAFDLRGLAIARVGFAEDVAFERQDAIVVRGSTPQHRAGGHDRPFGRLDRLDVAGTAGFACHAVIAGIDEADEDRVFLVEQRVAAFRVGRGRPVPAFGIFGQHMRGIARRDISGIVMRQLAIAEHFGISAMAVDAAQPYGRGLVHGRLIGAHVARETAIRLRRHLRFGLDARGRGSGHEAVIALDRLFLFRGAQAHRPGK